MSLARGTISETAQNQCPPDTLFQEGDQGSAFEHPAEVLFADALMLAGTALDTLEAVEGLVADFQPFQMHDADEFFAAFPNLPLLEFHAPTVVFKAAAGQR
jgi:hypothetical protein